MDLSIFNDIGHFIVKLKMYPFFDIANYILSAVAVRDDCQMSDSTTFSRRHPFASWLSTMLMCFAGSIVANFLTGDSVLTPFKNHDDLLLATLVWYLINYAPFDIAYRLVRLFPSKLVICVLKEVHRTKKIQQGISVAYKVYPSSYIVCIMIGIVKGSGAAEIQMVERLVRGVWLPASNEYLKPSFTSKASALISLLFLMEKMGNVVAPPDQIYLGAVMFLVYFRLSSLILGMVDPFAPFENVFCAIFMGGLVDALKRAIESSKTKSGEEPSGSKSASSSSSAEGSTTGTTSEEKKHK